MEILIWGTGFKGKETKKVCDEMGWIVRAFIDNDKTKLGVLNGIPVMSPDDISLICEDDVQVWICSGDAAVYKQAKEKTANVLGWEFVQLILTQKRRPLYPEVKLSDRNIRNCRLVEDREAMLRQFAAESSEWKMMEIGVAFGEFSEQILDICLPKRLFLVDLWKDDRFGGGLDIVQSKFRQCAEVKIYQGYSTQKLEEFKDDELDWVYIDTAHTYEVTKQELELCAKKVKPRGYICGHDYAKYNVYSRCDYGVYDAVNEFAVKENYEFIYLTMEEHGLQSFALRKIVEA